MHGSARYILTGAFLFGAVLFSAETAHASSLGQLKALIQDEAGRPLPDILVTLLQKTQLAGLPILTRTNKAGQIFLSRIAAGAYEMEVRSGGYQSLATPPIEILPGQTAMVTLVLQQLFNLPSSDQPNVTVKTLLRNSPDRRLIFRNLPDIFDPSEETFRPPIQNAVFQVYTSGGLGSDYLVFPRDSVSGTTTNFALTQRLLGNGTYVFAGQLNSGEDSLWRLRNFINYELSESHSLQLSMGYGRMSFDQPSLALLGNPIAIGHDSDFVNATGAVKMLSVGLEDRIRFGNMLAFVWGLELNQVRTGRSSYYYGNPNAEIAFSPAPNTQFRAMVASRRNTQRNTLLLPEGETVSLADAVYFSRVGDQFSLGTSRHYQASVTQRLHSNTELEVAAYHNDLFGGTVPLLAVFEFQPGAEVLQLDDVQADNRGYRISVRQRLGDHLKAAFSYTRGDAMGLGSQNVALIFNESSMRELIGRHHYHAVSTQLDAAIPRSKTELTAVVKLVPDGNPMTTLDIYSDVYETSNKGVNLFIRQLIPVPTALLNFLGLDFLAAYQVEALLDIRNLTNEDLGLIRTSLGDVVLLRNPRSLRGGISVRF